MPYFPLDYIRLKRQYLWKTKSSAMKQDLYSDSVVIVNPEKISGKDKK